MADFVLIVRTLLGGAWDAMTKLRYPLVDIPFAAILIGAFLVVVSLRLLGNVLGWSFSGGSIGSTVQSIGGNNKKVKVSETRKNDTK